MIGRRRVLVSLAGAAAMSGAGVLAAACAAGAGSVPASGRVAGRPAGSWARAIEVPGLGALNRGGDAFVGSVSCGSAGNCAAGGTYTGGAGHTQAFVVNQS